MKKKSLLSLLALTALLLCACQASPEKAVVVSKNDGAFDKNAAVSASEHHDPNATQAAKYTDAFTSTDGSVEYRIEIDETVTGADMPVVEVAPHFLTESEVKQAAQAIFGNDAVFYEAEPDLAENYSKSEIQDKLNIWAQFTSSEALVRLYGPQYPEYMPELIRQFIADYTTRLETAPTQSPHVPCLWAFQNGAKYLLTAEELESMNLSDFNEEISAAVKCSGIPYCFRASKRDRDDFKISSITVSISPGMGPSNLENTYFLAQICRTAKPTREQLTAVQEKAVKILSDMGRGQWKIDQCYVETRDLENALEYIVHVDAVPVLNGISAIRQPQLTNLESDTAFASNYYLTDASFQFSADGNLVFFRMNSPVDVVEIINDNVAVKSFDELMELAKNNLQLRDFRSFSFGSLVDDIEEEVRCSVTVTGLSYNLARVKAPDTDERYYYVPGITLLGSVEYCGKDSGKTYYASEAPEPLLALNGVDGSVISLGNS